MVPRVLGISCLVALSSCHYQNEGETTFTGRVVDEISLAGIAGIAVSYTVLEPAPGSAADSGRVKTYTLTTDKSGVFTFTSPWKLMSDQLVYSVGALTIKDVDGRTNGWYEDGGYTVRSQDPTRFTVQLKRIEFIKVATAPGPLTSIWGSGVNNVWVAGNAGVIMRWDGHGWGKVPGPATDDLTDLWGSGPQDLWAAGNGLIRWDGKTWSRVQVGLAKDLISVWGTAADDVWAGTYSGAFLRWDGSSWRKEQSAPHLRSLGIWGTGPSDVLVWGFDPSDTSIRTLGRWNGTSWEIRSYPKNIQISDAWGLGSDDLWLLDSRGGVLRWNGKAWLDKEYLGSHVTGEYVYDTGIWGSGASDVLVVGNGGSVLRWNGTKWSRIGSGATRQLTGIWGSSATDIWVITQDGAILKWQWP